MSNTITGKELAYPACDMNSYEGVPVFELRHNGETIYGKTLREFMREYIRLGLSPVDAVYEAHQATTAYLNKLNEQQ